MGSTTPVLALPYPVGTDRVMDGDNAIQALAEAVEAKLGFKAGAFTGTTDATGNLNIPHGLSVTPRAVLMTCGPPGSGVARIPHTFSISATTIAAVIRLDTGGPLAS